MDENVNKFTLSARVFGVEREDRYLLSCYS